LLQVESAINGCCIDVWVIDGVNDGVNDGVDVIVGVDVTVFVGVLVGVEGWLQTLLDPSLLTL